MMGRGPLNQYQKKKRKGGGGTTTHREKNQTGGGGWWEKGRGTTRGVRREGTRHRVKEKCTVAISIFPCQA